MHGMLFVFGVAISGWMIDDMVWTRGIPPEKYLFIALLVVATAYSGVKWLLNPPPPATLTRRR
jgi:hypothetical protein